MIKLYHGSNVIIDEIDLLCCNPYKDFGQAFYLTEEEAQAMDIANARVDIFGGKPVINIFGFDETLLSDGSLTFKSFDAYTEEWADFIYQHRDETIDPPYQHSFDVVYGPIANDRVGLQIRNYRLGNIDKQEFLHRLKYMKGITFIYFKRWRNSCLSISSWQYRQARVPPPFEVYERYHFPVCLLFSGGNQQTAETMNVSKQEFQFMVEGITSDLIQMLMDCEHFTLPQAVAAVYDSNIYAALQRPASGLYSQSSGYVYRYLKAELKLFADK